MFTYLHCYMPQTWDAQVRTGFIDEHSGIRFPQSIDIPEHTKFNNLAAIGGELHSLVRQERMPFYIDRLQGGCYIENYPYDMHLIRAYRDMLGENFWGFQMHEWMSNFYNDLNKLRNNHCPHTNGSGWAEEDIIATIRKAFPFPHLFLEAMTAREFAETGDPQTYEEFLMHAARLFDRRQQYTDNMLLPCDSAYLAYNLELKHGAKRIMPEIGAQTPNTRIQIAYARGMAKAYGVPFGAYYEPWGGDPFSACNYHKTGDNEWNIHSGADFPFETKGGNGGSSRSLQRRMHLYAYMAGAQFMSEEWSMSNVFYDWEDFDLTPYGLVKRDFLRFTRKYQDIGTLCAPIAIVLPKDLPLLETFSPAEHLCGFPISGSLAEKVRNVRNIVLSLLAETTAMKGTETCSLRNSNIPDAIDIVHEDKFNANAYRYLVDATGNPAFAAEYGCKICPAEDVPMLLDTILPCKVTGGLHSMVSQAADGTFYLMILNHSGVSRTVAEGERLLREEDKTVSVTCRDDRRITPLEGDGVLSYDNGVARITVPAGGWFFGRF